MPEMLGRQADRTARAPRMSISASASESLTWAMRSRKKGRRPLTLAKKVGMVSFPSFPSFPSIPLLASWDVSIAVV